MKSLVISPQSLRQMHIIMNGPLVSPRLVIVLLLFIEIIMIASNGFPGFFFLRQLVVLLTNAMPLIDDWTTTARVD